jgi:hypothetical protein
LTSSWPVFFFHYIMSETSSPSTSAHGLQLEHTADRSLSYFLAEAITNLLTATNPTALDTIADVTDEIRKRTNDQIRRRNKTVASEKERDKQLRYWLRLTSDHMRK